MTTTMTTTMKMATALPVVDDKKKEITATVCSHCKNMMKGSAYECNNCEYLLSQEYIMSANLHMNMPGIRYSA